MLPCVILGGGLGTRMLPHTEAMPKALLPVAGHPFVELQLEWLASQGVRDVLYSTGHKGEMIRECVGDGARFGLHVTYISDGPLLRGTAGALRHALKARVLPEAFFLLYGDSYLTIDLRAVEERWRAAGKPILMTVFENRGRWDQSNASLRADGLV